MISSIQFKTPNALTLMLSCLMISGLWAQEIKSESGIFTKSEDTWTLDYNPAQASMKLTTFASLSPDTPIENDSTMAVVVEFETTNSFVVGMEAGKTNGRYEVFRRQQITPKNNRALWLLEKRIGDAKPANRIYLEVGGHEAASATLKSFEIKPVSDLTVEDVFAATTFEPLSIKYSEYFSDSALPQEVSLSIPSEITRRFMGQQVAIIFDEKIKTIDIGTQFTPEGFRLEETIQVPVDVSELGLRQVRATIQSPENIKFHELATVSFSVRGPRENVWDSFEVPFRTIVDYEVFYNKPDLRLLALPQDMSYKPEPAGFESSSHELIDYTISLESGLFRPHVGWRVPNFDHWAEEGFSNLAIGRFMGAQSLYVTGGNADNLDIIGHGAIIDAAPLGAPINNPIYFPAEILTGWEEGRGIEVITAGAEQFQTTFFHLTQTTVHGEKPRMIGSISENVRRILDVKRMRDLESQTPWKHLNLFSQNGTWYLIADQTLWTSTSPFEFWKKSDFEFEPEQKKARIVDLEDRGLFLFHTEEINGRDVVRWNPFTLEPEPGFINKAIPHAPETEHGI